MSQPATAPFRIVMLAYPRMTQLDLTGPFEVFARLPGARLEIVAESCRRPVVDVAGLAITANSTFDEVAGCELLFVPGGPGQLELMDHGPTLDFLRRMAVQARYVTSVCTGSLILGAAGLLTGYRATSPASTRPAALAGPPAPAKGADPIAVSASAKAASRVLKEGIAPTPVRGRADDFTWPPPGSEPAAAPAR